MTLKERKSRGGIEKAKVEREIREGDQKGRRGEEVVICS